MREKLFSVTMADCDFEHFHAGGKGGQAQNTSDTGVRIRHRESGAVGEARDSRSQHQNKQAAWNRMVKSAAFQKWLAMKVYLAGEDIEAVVKKMMRPENLKIEGRSDNGWEIIG
jgi:protein subunit release factor A